jgi:hypothetical protein
MKMKRLEMIRQLFEKNRIDLILLKENNTAMPYLELSQNWVGLQLK